MTDYEKLKALLTEFGVGFEENTDRDGNPYISCKEGNTKIDGHLMFFTDFDFDKEEKFLKMGTWE